jgi:hypothetical protein
VVIIELSKKMIPLKLWSTFWSDVTGLRQISDSLFLKFVLVMIEEFTSSKRNMKWSDKKVISAYMMELIVPCLEVCLEILGKSHTSNQGAEAIISRGSLAHGTTSVANIPTGILGESPMGQPSEGAEALKSLIYTERPVEKLVLKLFLALCQHMDITHDIFPRVLEELFKISLGSNIEHAQLALSCLLEVSNKPFIPRGFEQFSLLLGNHINRILSLLLAQNEIGINDE